MRLAHRCDAQALSGKAVRVLTVFLFIMKKNIRARAFVPALSVLSLAGVIGAHAQQIEVNPVVISASRMEQPLSSVLPSVSVITREDIDRSQAPSLADLLQGEAGFEFGRNGGPGTTTSFFLRGEDSVNMVLMVDGVRAQTDSIGALQITDIPLDQIERIEILRGNASALYGEAAIGGVIQVFTRHSKGSPKAYGGVTAGSRGTYSSNVGFGGALEDWSFDLNAGGTHSTGFSAINAAQKPLANPGRDGYGAQFVSGRAERTLDSTLKVGFRLSSRETQTDYDDASYGSLPTDTHRFQQRNDLVGAFVRKAFNDDWVSTVDLADSELTYVDTKNGVPYTAGDFSYKNGRMTGHQSILRWTNEYSVQPATNLTFGAENIAEKFKAEGDDAYDMKRHTQAWFAGVTHKMSKWTMQMNLRQDDVTLERSDANSSGSNQSQVSTGLLGVGYEWTSQWRLTATTSTGFRAPTAYDVSNNALIKPEHHQGHEAGVVYTEGQSYARIVYFETHTTDAIGYDSNFNVMNIGETRNRGLEASYRTLWQGNTLRLSAVSQNPWSVTYDERLGRRAREYATFDVSRPFAEYLVGMKVVASGNRKDSHYDTNMLPGYAVASFYASRKINENWIGRVRVENAFNKQYQLAYGYNTPGVGVFATLQYQPK